MCTGTPRSPSEALDKLIAFAFQRLPCESEYKDSGPGMNYRNEQALRWVAFIGLIALAFSQSNGWVWGIYVGAVFWAATIPLTMSAFMARSIPNIWADIRGPWSGGRSREEGVPEVVARMAARLGVSPPKSMRVVPGLDLNAWVSKDTLSITEGLWSCLWTSAAEDILAHEMAHLSGKHCEKKTWAKVGLIFRSSLWWA